MYNTILRRFPLEHYSVYKDGGNTFPTTIAALTSAIVKISRVTKLPPDLELFRGLGGLVEMPPGFWKADANGCRGYVEYGFMSTTSSRATALAYSGVRDKKPKPTVRSEFTPQCDSLA